MDQPFELDPVDEAKMKGDLFRITNLDPLPHLKRSDETRGNDQRVRRAGVEPCEAASDVFDRWGLISRYIRLTSVISNSPRADGMRALCDLSHLVEPRAEKTVAEHEHRAIPVCEPLADQKGPSKTIGKALLSVFGPHSPVRPVVEQAAKQRQVMWVEMRSALSDARQFMKQMVDPSISGAAGEFAAEAKNQALAEWERCEFYSGGSRSYFVRSLKLAEQAADERAAALMQSDADRRRLSHSIEGLTRKRDALAARLKRAKPTRPG
jgi:hypothetical protein